MKICIDPGHSGPFEAGACAGGATEAEINLEVAKIAGRMLEKFGHKVLLTRTGDVDNNWLTWRCEAPILRHLTEFSEAWVGTPSRGLARAHAAGKAYRVLEPALRREGEAA